MKEIDFLPKWYRNGRRRQIGYRTQYAVLGGIFLMMVLWSFIAAHSVSRATAEVARLESEVAEAEGVSQKFAEVEGRIAELQKKANILQEIGSRIDVASVLAEMSFLIDERIVLGKVELGAEKFGDKQGINTGGGSSLRVADRAIQRSLAGRNTLSLGDVRFKVMIRGIAADASDVADLICRLEDSPYFCQVTLLFSRNRGMKTGSSRADKNYQVSEFELSCYLANYQQGHGFAKGAKNRDQKI